MKIQSRASAHVVAMLPGMLLSTPGLVRPRPLHTASRTFVLLLRRISVVLAVCLMAGQPIVAAQDVLDQEIQDGTLVVYLQSDTGVLLAGACFFVVDAEGGVHEKCDSGSGMVTFKRLPYGPATVHATTVPDGHHPAPPQSVLIVRDSLASARLTAVAIPETPPQTIEPPEELPDDPEPGLPEESETPTEEPAEEEDPGAGDAPVPGISGTPQFSCDPQDTGFRDFSVWIEATAPVDPAPTAQITLTDRFGNVTGPQTVTLRWDEENSWYIYSLLNSEYAEADFIVMADGRQFPSVGGGCGIFNPILMVINTMVQDDAGTDLPDGAQIESGTPFRDTAWFTGDDARFAPELAGQEVTYYLYKDDGTCTTPVWTQTVVVNPDGTIPPSNFFDPTGLGDGIYDWRVAFGGYTRQASETSPRVPFHPASSSCGAETVVVGQNETAISTTMKTADGEIIPNQGTVPIGTTVLDTTQLEGASADAGGTVIYRLYQGTCRNLTLVEEFPPVTVTNGQVPDSPTITPTELGDYQWIVVYSGDERNAPVTSHCGVEKFTVGQVQPSIETFMFAEDGTPIEQGDTVNRGTGVYDAAVIEGIHIPEGGEFTGTVTYTLYLGACPIDAIVGTQTLPVNPDGTLPNSPVFEVTEVGTYNWVVTYNDVEGGLNATAVSLCGSETFNVDRAPTTITTAPELRGDDGSFTPIEQNGVVSAPADVRDTAAIEGLGDDATGTVTYRLYRGSSCSGTPVATYTVTLNDDGSVPPSPVVEGLTPGQYNWVASYSGDTYHAPSSAACGDEQFFVTGEGSGGGYVHTVVRRAGNNAIVPDGGSVPLGTYVYDTAQFYGSIRDTDGNAAFSGEIVYNLYRGEGCDGAVAGTWSAPVTAGQPVPDMPSTHRFTQAGTYNFQAVFSWTQEGQPFSVASPCGTETVIVSPLSPTLSTHILNMDEGGTEVPPQSRLTRPVNVADNVTLGFGSTNVEGLPGPNGALTYRLYNNSGCTGTPFAQGTLPVIDGQFDRSATVALDEDDFGVFNWTVTFTSSDGNYKNASSACGKETFYLDAQPTLTTKMYQSPNGEGEGTALSDDGTVTVGDWVRDTAALAEFATGNPGATGSVTFTLHQGGSCTGTAMFSNTVQVAADGTIPSTGWYRIRLSGEYSWSATYSGNNSGGRGGFNKPAESICQDETFTADPAPDPASIETVMRQGETVIPHLSYIFRGASITDEAIFTNLSDQATGTVTYRLHRGSTCTQANLVYTSEKPVRNGIAERSNPYTVPNAGADGQVYSWVVTFVGEDQGEPVELVSECDQEQFRIFNTHGYSVGTTCGYNSETGDMTFSLYLRPRPVGGDAGLVTISMQPYARDLTPLDPLTIENEWEIHRTEQWRRVTGTAEWPNGSRATFIIRCNATPLNPELSTTMYQVTDDGDVVMPTGATTVPPGSVVYDTTQVLPGTATIVMSGTLTYQLLRGDSCETATPYGDPHVRTLQDDTPIGNLPPSDRVTVNDPGTYWWVVTYEPPADDEYPDNTRAVSECEAETFSVEPFETSLTTLVVTETGSSVAAATGEDVYDTATLTWSPEIQPNIMPTGTVTYNAYAGEGVCEGEPVWTSGPLPLNADGTLPDSGITRFLTAGDYEFQAVYSGDASFPAATSGCGTEPLRITAPTLTIEKVALNETISAGEQIGFRIVVTNPGPGVATGVTLTDALPEVDGITWEVAGVSHESCILAEDGGVTCGPVDLDAGQTLQLQITGSTTAESCGEVTNAASFDSENTNDGEEDATVTILCPDVVVEKTASAAEVSAGDEISFTMTMTNNGPGTAYDATLVDTLPSNAGLVWTWSSEDGTCAIEGGVLTCDFGTLGDGASASVTVSSSTTPETCGPANNSVRVSAGNEPEGNVDEENEDSASVTVHCPDVVIAKTTASPSVNASDQVRFDITISNAGEGTASNVQVSDVLPAGLTWTLVDAVDGCELVAEDNTGRQEITCAYESMAPGTEHTISVVAETSYETCGIYENAATISAENEPAGDRENNESTATVEVLCSDVELTKVAEDNEISSGDRIAFTISMVNNGDGVAYDAVLTDILPTNAGLIWEIDPAVERCAIADGVLTCEVGDLQPEGTFSVRISSITTAETCGTVDNDALVEFRNAPDEGDGDRVAVLCPDVSILKTAVQGTINATDTASFQLVITNAGPGTAYDVAMTDALPAGITGWTVEYDGCAIVEGVLTCEFAEMAPGATHTIVVSAPTTLEMCGPHENLATIGASNEPESDEGSNESTATISVNCSEVDLQKVAERDEVSAGDGIAFTISMVNNGEGVAYDAVLTDTLPTDAGLSWTIEPENDACVIEEGVLTCEVGDLAQGDEFSVRIESVTTAGTCGVVDNSAVVEFREGNTEPAHASDQVIVHCPTPAIEKVADDGEVSAGDEIGFTITASNGGPGNAYDVVLTDTLPATQGTDWTIAGGEGAESCVIEDGALLCEFGTMEPGSSWSVRLVSPTAYETCSVVGNRAEMGLSNGDPVDSAEEITVLCPDPVIEKVADEGTVSAGDDIGFTITVTNHGQGNAYGVRLADTLPTTPGTAWTIAGGDGAELCEIVDGTLQCEFGTLEEGETLDVRITSPTTAETCGVVDNTAVVTPTNAPSGEASDAVTVNCSNPVIEKTPGQETVSAGDEISFIVTVTNAGAGNAYDVVLADTLPVVPGVEWTIAGGTGAERCVIEDGVLRCDLGTMAPEAVLDVVITSPTTAESCASIDNEAAVSASNESGDTTEDNTSSASVTVNCPDVTVLKVADADVISAGDEIDFTMTVSNTGDGNAYDVTLTDTLPDADGTFWTIAGGAGAESCVIENGVLRCDLGTLESGASVDVRISSVTSAATCGVVENSAMVGAGNEPGDATGDNTSSASVIVNCPDVTIVKMAGSETVGVGETVSFSLEIANIGAGTANDVVVTDRLPAGFDWTVSGDAEGCAIADGVLTCEIPAMEPGATLTISVSATGVAEQCGAVENAASVSSGNEPEEAGAGNDSSASLTLTCPPERTPGMKPGAPLPPITELPDTGSGADAGTPAPGGLALGALLLAGAGWSLRRREAA